MTTDVLLGIAGRRARPAALGRSSSGTRLFHWTTATLVLAIRDRR